MLKTNWTSAIPVAVLFICCSFVSGQFYEVESGLIDGISDNGVGSGSTLGNGHYFRWTIDGGSQDIGGVSPGNGVGGEGDISQDGRYISGTTFNAAEGYHEMSRYDSDTGTWTGFGLIPVVGQQIDSSGSSGWGISGDGQSVVGQGWTDGGFEDLHAFQWKNGVGPIDLGPSLSGHLARATAASFDGNVVVGWQDGPGAIDPLDCYAAVWVGGVPELIEDNDEFVAQEARDVSGDGQWVTGLSGNFGPAAVESFRYNTVTDTYQSIPNLAVGGRNQFAGAGITDDGRTIVGGTWAFGSATSGNAVIWEEGVGTILLSDYLEGKGIDVPDTTTLAYASAISSDGQWIAGWSGPGSSSSSWVVRVPEPGTGVLLFLAMAALGFIRPRV